jgi:hypothetical protein
MGILEQPVEGWASDPGSANPVVDIFLKDGVTALPGELTNFEALSLGVLVKRRNT